VHWHCWLGGRKGIWPVKMRDGGGGHWLVQLEWRPAGWSVCLPLLIFACTIKSRSSLLAPAHPGGLGKRAVKRWWWWWWHCRRHRPLKRRTTKVTCTVCPMTSSQTKPFTKLTTPCYQTCTSAYEIWTFSQITTQIKKMNVSKVFCTSYFKNSTN